MESRGKKPALFRYPGPGSVLFLFGAFDAIICFFEPENFCHRAGRADTAFLLKGAGRRLPHNTEEQTLIGSHAFIIARAWFADALPPVFSDNCFLITCHDIPRPVLPGLIHK